MGLRLGTGVGLACCKTIMIAYGGDIICNSIEGEYTEFVLSFSSSKIKLICITILIEGL